MLDPPEEEARRALGKAQVLGHCTTRSCLGFRIHDFEILLLEDAGCRAMGLPSPAALVVQTSRGWRIPLTSLVVVKMRLSAIRCFANTPDALCVFESVAEDLGDGFIT